MLYQLNPEEVAAIQGVDLILGSDNKFDAVQLVNQLEKNNPKIYTSTKNQPFEPVYSFGDRTRSFLKVQDGCDYYCSYCTIPQARDAAGTTPLKIRYWLRAK
jgi:threonylcarbamoyladenosine tRNA methylthiotransferase MtaB